MTAVLRGIELGFIILMVSWTVGALAYALPFPAIRRRLERINAPLWFADWTVFGAGDEQAVISAYTLEYRDHRPQTQGAWLPVIDGRPWAWHAFLWQPQRRIADRLHRMAQDLARLQDNDSPAAQRLRADHCRRIANHVAAACPRSPGCAREIRILRHHATVTVAGETHSFQEVLLSFSPAPIHAR